MFKLIEIPEISAANSSPLITARVDNFIATDIVISLSLPINLGLMKRPRALARP